jgi:glycine/D-amino acid oxidase-like deaminating enzyme
VGGRIFGDSAVTAWRQDGSGHVLETSAGKVRARHVVLATNGYTPAGVGGVLATRILPVFSNILVTRVLSQQELQEQGWLQPEIVADDRDLLHYFRLLPDGRFMFGGRGGISGHKPEEAMICRRLQREFGILFPAWQDVSFDYFWSGLVCLCRDLVFHLGRVPGRDNAWYGLAFHGGGVSMASWSGAALAEMIVGSQNSRYKVPGPMLKSMPAMPIPSLRPWYLRSAYAWYGIKERLLGTQLVRD